jgi:hypothetical protein
VSTALGLLKGAVAALIAWLLGALVVGMGHGWNLPIYLSVLLGFLVYPATSLVGREGWVADVAGKALGLCAPTGEWMLVAFGDRLKSPG